MQIHRITLLIMIIFSLLLGCVPSNEIEKLGVIHTRGVDILKDGEKGEFLDTTLIVLLFDSQRTTLTVMLTGKGKTVKGARQDANYQTSYHLVPGQINVELFSRELAERGLAPYLNGLVRDARDKDTAQFAITTHTAKEILEAGEQKLDTNVGQFLENLIEKEVGEDRVPETTISDFGHKLGEVGIDPVLPIIDLVNNIPKLTGIAVFQNDKYVGQLSMEEALLVNLSRKKITATPIEVSIPGEPFKSQLEYHTLDDNEEISLRLTILKGKTETKLTNKENLTFNTRVNLITDVNGISKFVKIDKKVIALFEKEIEKELKGKYEKLLKQLQEVNADALGYGTIYRTKLREKKLTDKEWREKFPNIKVNFDVNVEIENYGTIR